MSQPGIALKSKDPGNFGKNDLTYVIITKKR